MAVISDGGGGVGVVEADMETEANDGELFDAEKSKSSVNGPCVFSESILWKIQRQFYESHGVQCWQQVCMVLRVLFTLF